MNERIAKIGQLSRLVTVTTKPLDAKLRKRGNPLVNVTKVSRIILNVGCDLQRIEDRQAKDDNREPRTIGPPPWGSKHVDDTCLLIKDDSYYLQGVPNDNFRRVDNYFVNGRPASERDLEIIAQFAVVKPTPSSMAIKIDNIARIAGNGEVL